MSNFSIEGRLCHIGQPEAKTEKFTVRSFWIETEDQYPQTISFQLTNDRCDLLDKHAPAAQVRVHFNLRGRKYTDKVTGQERVFNTLDVWRMESLDATDKEPASTPRQSNAAPADPVPGESAAEIFGDLDLPF